MSKYIEFKPGKEIEWLEINVLKNGEALSKSLIVKLTDGIATEDDVDSWLSELEQRIYLYNKQIYKIEGNRIIGNFSWEEIPEYFLCLYYSYYGANDYSGGTKLFEKISACVLKNFIDGNSFTLGFPTSKNLNSYIDEICSYCFENKNMPADTSYKDDGVDVVGYKLFEDGRGANLYVLLQCAAGTHWKLKKQITMNRWTNYIQWFPENIIQSISTVEYVKTKDWYKQTSTYGMLIDRVRIFNYLYKTDDYLSLRSEVLEWCQIKIAEGI